MNMNNQSLCMQDGSGSTQPPEKPHARFPYTKTVFKALFKGIEVLWMIMEIIDHLREIF